MTAGSKDFGPGRALLDVVTRHSGMRSCNLQGRLSIRPKQQMQGKKCLVIDDCLSFPGPVCHAKKQTENNPHNP